MSNNVRIVCVLKRSDIFDVQYVEKLKEQLDAYAPHVQFSCISNVDVPCERIPMKHMWPGWWCKMELFRPDITGDIFFVDLDTIICSPIDDLLSVGKLTMLDDFFFPQRVASGVMYLPEDVRGEIWHHWIKNTIGYMRQHRRGGDQAFLGNCFGNKPSRWQKLFPDRIVSYKADKVNRDGYKEGMGVICFHGRPKPRDVQWEILNIPPLPKQPTVLPS